MNETYVFDQFQDEQQRSEITRLTANVESHTKTICEIFLNHGLIEAKQVLDVGCGTGSMIELFSSLLPETLFVGIDNSESILKHASEKNKANIEWVQAEANALPFPDNSFDFVYTRLVLLHNNNPKGILEEMKRVCKPGGAIVSVEVDDGTMIFYPYSDELDKLMKAYIEYSRIHGMDRTMGRKLFPLYKNADIDDVKIIVQTSDYTAPFEEVPFPIKLALGLDNGQRLVEQGLLTDEELNDILHKIQHFSKDEHRFYSGSFMYAIGKKM